MIQKQGDDGDHNSMDAYSGKVAPAHVLTHSLTHSLTRFPTPHTHRLPPGYRDLIEFFSRNPGLVKWTGIPLLLYFNAGSLDAAPMLTLRLPLLRLTITPHPRAPSTLTTTVMIVSTLSISLTFGFWRRRTPRHP